jgi:hypothetical protein
MHASRGLDHLGEEIAPRSRTLFSRQALSHRVGGPPRLTPLPQLAWEGLSEAGYLIGKAGPSVEVEVPSVARKPPVADVGDLPVGRRFEAKDEIYAPTIWAVDLTPAEDHLTTVPITTDLPRREAERDQNRIENLPNEVLHNRVRTTLNRIKARNTIC